MHLSKVINKVWGLSKSKKGNLFIANKKFPIYFTFYYIAKRWLNVWKVHARGVAWKLIFQINHISKLETLCAANQAHAQSQQY